MECCVRYSTTIKRVILWPSGESQHGLGARLSCRGRAGNFAQALQCRHGKKENFFYFMYKMVIQNYLVRARHHLLCILMARRMEAAALQALK